MFGGYADVLKAPIPAPVEQPSGPPLILAPNAELVAPWREPGAEIIRCSSLPTWPDCPRRWMAQHRRGLLDAAGYPLTELWPSIGAACGSATHAGVAYSWTGRSGGDWSSLAQADDAAVTELERRIKEEGAQFDDTTPTLDAAQIASRKMIRSYRDNTRPSREPILIEAELAGLIAPGWYLVGHCDLFASDGPGETVLDDLKTGVAMPAPIAQLGGYRRLIRAGRRAPARTTMTYIRRVRQSAEQPPPLVKELPGALADRTAGLIAKEIVAKVETLKAGNVDPLTFPCNPSSVLCGSKYCSAFHTSWCPESLVKEDRSR